MNAMNRLLACALFAACSASGAQLLRTSYPDLTARIGQPCLAELTFDLARDAEVAIFYVGHPKGGNFWHMQREMRLRKGRRIARFFGLLPENLNDVQLRVDVNGAPLEAVKLVSARFGAYEDFFPNGEKVDGGEPELLFHAPFDGTVDAAAAKGRATPVAATNLTFAPGRFGQALRVTDRKAVLAYAAAGNFNPERGSVSFWFKPLGDDADMLAGRRQVWRNLVSLGLPGRLSRAPQCAGANALWLWNDRLRGETGSLDDDYDCALRFLDNRGWQHVTWTWDEFGSALYVDGEQKAGGLWHGCSPFDNALKRGYPLRYARRDFPWLYVGTGGGGRFPLEGLIDDFRVYSAPISRERIRELAQYEPKVEHPDYAAMFRNDGPNPHEGPATVRGGVPELEPVEAVRLDRAGVERLRTANRFTSTGGESFARLGACEYLEAGTNVNARYAIRFTLDPSVPIHCFEIDYPDDAPRAMDFILQSAKRMKTVSNGNSHDYTMQVGLLTGDDYPNGGTVKTHRCLYWTNAKEVALIAMNARKDAPAKTGLRPTAVAAVRLCRVKGGRLPVAKVNEPEPLDGWTRMACLFFEDPAIGYDFATPGTDGKSFKDQATMIDRTAALMKFTGLNLFAYPGAWYEGLIGASWDPRNNHAPDYLSAWYEKFDREGLFVMPTVNQFRFGLDAEVGITRRKMADGSFYGTEVAIHDTGYPNWGGWHGSPPNYCVAHPRTQKLLAEEIDHLIRQGVRHRSFKGVCLHISRHSFYWWGDLESGYNDYVIEAFERRSGLKVPRDMAKPWRGRDAAKWIKANAREAFLDYRVDVVTAFYARLAAQLRAARPDLRLWVNLYDSPLPTRADFLDPLCAGTVAREGGIDVAKLQAAIPNLIVTQTQNPADHRKFELFRYADRERGPAWHRDLETSEAFFRHIAPAAVKFLHHHDRYWENPIGRTAPLKAPWLDECVWRVTTLNPAGVHALKHFVEPFRYHDFFGVSKGGYLIGTYGMEDVLTPFLQAFRALPPVAMETVGTFGAVTVRKGSYRGRDYVYFVNTDWRPAKVKYDFTGTASDLVTGATFTGKADLVFAGYALKSFVLSK